MVRGIATVCLPLFIFGVFAADEEDPPPKVRGTIDWANQETVWQTLDMEGAPNSTVARKEFKMGHWESHPATWPGVPPKSGYPVLPCDIFSLDCDKNLTTQCVFGGATGVQCKVKSTESCIEQLGLETGDVVELEHTCTYCFQLPDTFHECSASDPEYDNNDDDDDDNGDNGLCKHQTQYVANCDATREVLCLGARSFHKRVRCWRNSDRSQRSATLFSFFLGGFAGERFFLGYPGVGLAKFFTFGGLGVWSIFDTILVLMGLLEPNEGAYKEVGQPTYFLENPPP